MKLFKPLHALPLLLAFLLLPLPVRAGNPNFQPFPQDNDLVTNTDDKLVFKVPKWHGNDELRFYVARFAGEVMLPLLNDPNEGGQGISGQDVQEALTRAIEQWNGARYGGQLFSDLVMFSDQAPPPLGMPQAGDGISLAIDGLNLVTFLDEDVTVDASAIGMTRLTYFLRDFNLEDIVLGNNNLGIPGHFVVNVIDANEAPLVEADPDFDGIVDFRIPLYNYKQGEVFDVDIVFNTTYTPNYRAWPADLNEVPTQDEGKLNGSLDLQGIMMSRLGWIKGAAYSLIADSVMYRYWDPPTSIYPSNIAKKRKLAFDDEITVGLVEGSNFADAGTIRGQVLDGAQVDGVLDEADPVLPYIPQVPVFVSVRPETLKNSNLLAGGQTDLVEPAAPHPDNVESEPLSEDENAGTYRRVAQVLTGQDIEVLAGLGGDFTDLFDELVVTPDEAEPVEPPAGNPDFEFADNVVSINFNQFNSTYVLPGLPENDDVGGRINYAVELLEDTELPVNGQDQFFSTITFSEGSVGLDYPAEFYGGSRAPLNLGNGEAEDENITADEFFENNYITAQFDKSGRFAAAINDGPGILSGYNDSPRSYIVLKTGEGSFSNKFGPIAVPSSSVVIDDANNNGRGTWSRPGNFSVRTFIEVTDSGAVNGVPTALEVSHIVTNLSTSPQNFSLRQVLDAYVFGRENPIYVKDDGSVVEDAVTLTGGEIPDQLVWQSSRQDPAFRGFVILRQTGQDSPNSVTIAEIKDLGKSNPSGSITDYKASNKDTGIALNYSDIALQPGEARIIKFVIGYLPVGSLVDTWAPASENTEDPIVADQDDPGMVEPVQVSTGEVTDGIDIITNTGTSTGDADTGQSVEEGYAAGPLRFLLDGAALPDKNFNSSGGELADVDNDGDLDLVVCAFGGGSDPIAGSINRLYLNQQRVNRDGSVSYYYQDVTFGSDGVPGTSDDRMPVIGEQTLDVVIADFDGDGDVDLFFTNRNAPNRLYVNRGTTGDPSRLGFFADASDLVPGLLNTGINFGSSRATAGDIDSDGDLDIIISLEYPMEAPGRTIAWLDADPRDDTFPAGDRRFNSESDLFSEPLLYTERVLINMVNTPNYSPAERGFYFRDETLGADDRAGTLTNAEFDVVAGTTDTLEVVAFDPADFDRMPPVFPAMFNVTAVSEDSPLEGDTAVNSPMGLSAAEPHLGPFASDGSLDLFSVRSRRFTYGFASDIPVTQIVDEVPVYLFTARLGPNVEVTHSNEPGYFRNIDLFSLNPTGDQRGEFFGQDGIADGYFACINFNVDYGAQFGGFEITDGITQQATPTGPGLFVIEPFNGMGFDTFVRDPFPLFMGMPEGHPGDYTPDSDSEIDVVQVVTRGGWAGALIDLDYSGAPKAFIAADNDASGGLLYSYRYGLLNSGLMGFGASRGPAGQLLAGAANQYFPVPVDPYLGFTQIAGTSNEWTGYDFEDIEQAGEPFGVVTGDFDRDGDDDIYMANSTVPGITLSQDDGTLDFILTGEPATNQVLLNDSLGNFTEATGVILPNTARVSLNTTSGDIDNDGDLDLVVFNSLSRDEVFVNQIFSPSKKPNFRDDRDPTIFFEGTQSVIPPLFSTADAAPFPQFGALNGVTIKATIADWNGDGRDDVALAEGGEFTQAGSVAQLLFNRGQPINPTVPVLQPAGADFPAPRLLDNATIGAKGTLGFVNDVVAGDFNNDGSQDMLIVKSAPTGEGIDEGTQLLINVDTDNPAFNSVPDPNSLGDGVFVLRTLPDIVTPGITAGGLNLKLQGRRGATADLDGDGDLDIVIANSRDSGGAPNLLLINQDPGTATFVDATETNLPLNSGGQTGLLDNTKGVVLGDFDSDGDVDIIFANESNSTTPDGFRLLLNNGNAQFVDAPAGVNLPILLNTKPRGIVVADFDGLGEWTEDKNYNGYLDPGEDLNANGVIDFEDKPDESAGGDADGDGVVAKRTDGVWDGSLDVFVSLDGDYNRLLLNDPANPGALIDSTAIRIPEGLDAFPSRGVAAGDINLDGLPDIVVSQFIGGLIRPVRVYINQRQGGKAGYFKDATYEVPFSRSTLLESEQELQGANDQATTGWANDVKLVDIDGDGDLDMYVATLGNALTPVTLGSQDVFYFNRTIGDGFNFKPRDLARTPGTPVVYGAFPSGARRNEVIEVKLTGENFEPGTLVAFGADITVEEITYLDPNRLIVRISVSPTASLGPRRIIVENPSGGGTSSSTKYGLFSVYDGLGIPYRNDVPDRVWTMFE